MPGIGAAATLRVCVTDQAGKPLPARLEDLNLGFRLPPSAGPASGVKPAPVGYNRVYVKVPGGLTLEKWYAALKRGDNFVTNGPIPFVGRKSSRAIYLDGKYDARADARYFLDWIDHLILESKADPKRFANDNQRDELLAPHARAREFYDARAR